MSALGQKQTFALQKSCPLYPKSDHHRVFLPCPLWARSATTSRIKLDILSISQHHSSNAMDLVDMIWRMP